jgi:hypothetical protein
LYSYSISVENVVHRFSDVKSAKVVAGCIIFVIIFVSVIGYKY